MVTSPKRIAPESTGAWQPVPPSLQVRIVMRPMTKVLNPLIARHAGRPHFGMAARLRHTGRRSGRTYTTPVGARLVGEHVVIPLTFGNQSDWAKNVRAAGGCSITANGREYRATQPEFLDARQAAPLLAQAFNPVNRIFIRVLGIRQYLSMRITPDE
jgi:deazaflavin-dependent oxidoreductase (nitroreductase family)